MRDVAVIGIGITKFGELWESSLRDLWVDAALDAITDAGVDHIDSFYVGNMSGGLFVGQEHLGSVLADYLGMNPVPGTRVETACASGGAAFRMGFIEIASGMSDLVLVSGVEKMNDVSGDGATYALATAADMEYEAFHGLTFPGLYAMIARAHMHKYGTTQEQLAHVSVKNHANGALNPKAQYPFPITVDQVLNSVMVADPLHILDCSPITDGAAAVLLCPLDKVKDFTKNAPIKIIGSGHASSTIALHDRKDITYFDATEVAAKKAFAMAGVGPKDIDFAEVHDCFTIAEICSLEAMGFVEVGKGGKAAEEGLTRLDGDFPVNSSGGLKAKGHPVGASGVAQIVELVTQMRGDAGKRSVKKAHRGLAHNMGGSCGSALVHILEVV